MMTTTLLIMSAGTGSTYSGNWQGTGMGPNRELFVDYSIHDALKAGFNKIIFVIRKHMFPLFERRFGKKLMGKAEVVYAFQELDSLPVSFTPPSARLKPYGTTHAVLSARKYIQEPFAVINADDYYGKEAFPIMVSSLENIKSTGEISMVGYYLQNVVSEYGHVTRGICSLDSKYGLQKLEEANWIIPRHDGSIIDIQTNRILDPQAVVSMNFWGFSPWLLVRMEDYLDAFLHSLPYNELKEEYSLLNMINDLIKDKEVRVNVMPTTAKWYGVTYQLERAQIRDKLKSLHVAGVYPANLYTA